MQGLLPSADAADPDVPAFELPAHWRAVEFISDVHLSSERPRTAAAFFDRLDASPADAVCLLGDLFDVWVGDDVLGSDGFEGDCTARLQAASRHRPLYLMPGNRDFLVGARFHADSGCRPLPDPCVLKGWGTRVLLTHGDAWCLADHAYQRFRKQVRDPAWQKDLLNRPLTERRMLGRQIRAASEQHKVEQGPAGYADVDEPHAATWLERAKASVLVHGHTHRPASEPFGLPTSVRHVLSDWEADEPAVRGDVLRWTPAGIERLTAPFLTRTVA